MTGHSENSTARAPAIVGAALLLAVTAWTSTGSALRAATEPLAADSLAPLAWRVDVNVAPAHELTLLPRIGPTLAGRIVADREEHGDFRDIEDLARVRGIGPRTVLGIGPDVIVRPSAGAGGR